MTRQPIRFVRGNRFCLVMPARDGRGFQGLCDGRVVVQGDEMATTLGMLIQKTGIVLQKSGPMGGRPVDRYR